MAGFTAKQVVALTGVPYKRLDSWANSGFLIPSIAEADGTGSRRLYSFQDLITLRTAKLLRDTGISLRGLRNVVQFLRDTHRMAQPLAHTRLVMVGDDVLIVQTEGDLMRVLRHPSRHVLHVVVDLGCLVQALCEEVDKLRAA
jgi:DNA-binding transcriptional MerR regulator